MKQIRVTEAQRDAFHDKKEPGESYADMIERVYGVDKDE